MSMEDSSFEYDLCFAVTRINRTIILLNSAFSAPCRHNCTPVRGIQRSAGSVLPRTTSLSTRFREVLLNYFLLISVRVFNSVTFSSTFSSNICSVSYGCHCTFVVWHATLCVLCVLRVVFYMYSLFVFRVFVFTPKDRYCSAALYTWGVENCFVSVFFCGGCCCFTLLSQVLAAAHERWLDDIELCAMRVLILVAEMHCVRKLLLLLRWDERWPISYAKGNIINCLEIDKVHLNGGGCKSNLFYTLCSPIKTYSLNLREIPSFFLLWITTQMFLEIVHRNCCAILVSNLSGNYYISMQVDTT